MRSAGRGRVTEREMIATEAAAQSARREGEAGKNRVILLGVRGSIPVSGPSYARYGGASTCFLLRLGGEPLLVDAGTGLLGLPAEFCALPRLPLFMTHPHVDHMMGLMMCPYVFSPGHTMEIYCSERRGQDGSALFDTLFRPPLWPVGPAQLPARIEFLPLHGEPFDLGNIRVETMEGVHPGGVTVFRFTGGGASVVVATDCTLTESLLPKLTDFARDCDLLLIDGQYSDTEWSVRRGFGHSSWNAAAAFGTECGAKKIRIIHHDPCHTDEDLDRAEAELKNRWPACAFGREGEELIL